MRAIGTMAVDPPGYLRLLESGELLERVQRLEAMLAPCRICPRECGVDRMADQIGPCFAGRYARLAAYCDHHGEEPPIAGTKGSGTLFFAQCTMRCVYCQNHQISQTFHEHRADRVGSAWLAEVMLQLQRRGCHNINLVSPTQYSPQIMRGILQAAEMGLQLPIVYNTNAYETIPVLRELAGIVDVYLPDLKYGDDEAGAQYSRVRGYSTRAREAIIEMWRQVGPLQLDENGLARRGLIIRHLVLPNDLSDTEVCLSWIRETLGPEVTISLMGQYYPAHRASRNVLLNRRITPREYTRAIECAMDLGLHNLLIQDEKLAPEFYTPDFDRPVHPFEAEKNPGRSELDSVMLPG